MYSRFGFIHFLQRWLLALVLVFATWNPLGYSYLSWVRGPWEENLPLKVLAGIVLLIVYIIFARATWRSVGVVGLVLIGALFAAMLWTLVFYGLVSFENRAFLRWAGLVVLATVMAIGLSWSHVRRRLSGQIDTDDVDE